MLAFYVNALVQSRLFHSSSKRIGYKHAFIKFKSSLITFLHLPFPQMCSVNFCHLHHIELGPYVVSVNLIRNKH